jgi:hypothetical protein
MATKKIDALLDTIDTETSDLEEFIDAQESTVDNPEPILDAVSEEFDEEILPFEDVGARTEPVETAAEPESGPQPHDVATDSALDALSDAENEVEAMLSGKGGAEDGGASAVPGAEEDAGDPDSDKILAELLSTREVDASELVNKGDGQEEPEVKPADGDQVFDDLFSEIEATTESNGDGTASAVPPAPEEGLAEDLFGDQETPTGSGEEVSSDSDSSFVGEELSDDLFEDLKLESKVEPNTEVDAVGSSDQAESQDELAELISKKMETLVMRLVEEQLPELADRIISEKLKKIISSMK